MKKIIACSAACIAMLMTVGVVMAQKTINDPNVEKRNVTGFHAIEIGGGIDLYLSQGNEAVAVSAADPKYRDKIKTEVENGVLKIHFEPGEFKFSWSDSKKKLRAYVSVKNLDALDAGGGSDIIVDGTLKLSKLDMSISGGSDFKGKVDIESLKVEAHGGSDVDIAGVARALQIEASGGSDFDGFDLAADTCSVEASGGSDISITVNKELNVESSGGSDVHYKGSAVIRNVSTGGGGSVKKSSK